MAANETKGLETTSALHREAAIWFERIHAEEASTEDLGEWQRWLMSSTANQQAFRRVEDFWRRAGELEKPPWATPFELDVDTYDGTMPIASCRRGPAPHRRGSFWALAASLGVLAVALGLYLLVFRGISGWPDFTVFETASSEHRDITLSDGTKVLLGAQSTISVDFTDEARNVVVDSGEVFFNVAPDNTWPFVVRAGAGTITAVGTAFNVENLQGRVVVTVAEGSVDVVSIRAPAEMGTLAATPAHDSAPAPIPTRVEAGQRLVYGKMPIDVQPVDTERVLAWRQGRLEYMGEPLKFVIPDVARYTDRQIVITDPAVEEMLYTGSVMEDEVDDWLTSLGNIFPIDIARINENRVVLQARTAPQEGE